LPARALERSSEEVLHPFRDRGRPGNGSRGRDNQEGFFIHHLAAIFTPTAIFGLLIWLAFRGWSVLLLALPPRW
jgi:hypothetical protein